MLRIIWMATMLFTPALVISDIGSKINAAIFISKLFFLNGNVYFITATFEIVSTNYLVERLL